MKKAFALNAPGKADARVVEAIKNDVRKYVKRERNKTLPEGFDVWEFNCSVGLAPESAEPKSLKDIGTAIDGIAQSGAKTVFVEVLAVPAHRQVRPTPSVGALPIAPPPSV